MAGEPPSSSRLSADIDRTLREINRSFDPLKKDFPFAYPLSCLKE